MIGTNRDLVAMRDLLDREIVRLQTQANGRAKPDLRDPRLVLLCRQRIAVCAALINRRIEASNKAVVFDRWVSGNGALGSAGVMDTRQARPRGAEWRSRPPL